MKIRIEQFSGMRPAREPHLLEFNEAQIASNVLIETGALAGYPGSTDLKNLTKTTPATIWRYPASAEVDHWLEFTGRASVARSPITQDVWDRLYWTESSGMRYGPSAIVLSGSTFPDTSYKVGVPAPTNTPVISAFTAGVTPNIETRVYFETFVTAYDEEGPPGPASVSHDVDPRSSVTVSSLTPVPTGEWNINRRRIYRSSYTGSTLAQAQLVVELPVATTSYVDSVAQANLGKVMDSEGYEAPVDGVHSLTMTDAGIAVVAKGRDVFFSENWLPHAFDPANKQTLQYDVVNLAAFEQTVIALTTGRLYAGSGSAPGGIQLTSIRNSQSCASAAGVVVMEGGVLYPSPTGLVSIGTDFNPVEVTKTLLTPSQWAALNPSSFIATLSRGAYIAFFTTTGGVKGVLSIDASGRTPPYIQIPQIAGSPVTAAYFDQKTAIPYTAAGTKIKRFGLGSPGAWQWRSKDFDLGLPRIMGAGLILGDAGTVTVKTYADGVLIQTTSATVGKVFRLPSGHKKRRWSFEILGSSKVTQAIFAPTVEELYE